MKVNSSARHLANGLAMALVMALLTGLLYVSVLYGVGEFEDDSRVKRSLLADNEYLFKNGVHKVHWSKSKKSAYATSSDNSNANSKAEAAASNSLPSPSRYDKKTPLEYIFISVKTATKFHLERLQVLIDTWFTLAPDQVRMKSFRKIFFS